MQISYGNLTQGPFLVRDLSIRLSTLLFGLHAGVSKADWGENWGEMTWGVGGGAAVPLLDGWGLALLPILLAATALVLIAKRGGSRTTLVLFVALALPFTAYAATIGMPNIFSNGSVADANEINANFDTLVVESNTQDGRISTLEGGVISHTHPGGDITSQVGDADTVDGVHAIDLEESAEIIANIAAHALTPAAHHIRYSDVEALAAAVGVDAGTLDGLDSTDFASASHTHATYSNVATVAVSGGDYVSPKTAMDDVATWCGIPSSSNPCLLRIMPGTYDLGSVRLDMQSYVDIEGSGEETTTIFTANSTGSLNAGSAAVVGANLAELRFLSVVNAGGATHSIAIYNNGSSPKITNVTARGYGGGSNNRGMFNVNSAPTLTNVTAEGFGGTVSHGIFNTSSSPIMTNVHADASGATNLNFAVRNFSFSDPIMTNDTLTASGGSLSSGFNNSADSSPVIRSVSVNDIMLTGNTLFIPESGDDILNGTRLLAVDGELVGLGSPTAARRYLLRLDSGTYDLGSSVLTMQSYLDIAGSGENQTTITSTNTTTIEGANDSELRFLAVENYGTTTNSQAIHNNAASPKITHVTAMGLGADLVAGINNISNSSPILTHVTVTASGGTDNTGIINNASSPTMSLVTIVASGGTSALGVENFGASPRMSNITVNVSGATNTNYGISNSSSSTSIANVQVVVSGGTTSVGIYNLNSSLVDIRDTSISVSGAATDNWAMWNFNSDATFLNVNATASGGAYAYGFLNQFSDATMRSVTATASTGTFWNYGVYSISNSKPNFMNSTLFGTTNAVRNASGSAASIASSMIAGSIAGTGYRCVAAFDSSFLPLNNACL